MTPAARRFAVGVLVVASGFLANCQVDKLVSPPVAGVLVPSATNVADSAPKASTAIRSARIALGTSTPSQLNWRAERARSSAWLGFVRATGNAPDTLVVQLNPAGLDSGVYHDTVIVSTNNSEAPPLRLPVRFDVHPCRVTAVPLDTVVTGPLDGTECGSPRASGVFARLFGFSGTAGDSVTLELQATGFDANLLLDTTATGNGTPPLTQATACRGAAGDPCITYFRLPVSGDYFVEVSGATPSSFGTFVLNVADPSIPDAAGGPGQFLADSVSPINIGALVSAGTVVFGATLHDADVVDTLRLEIEMRRVGVTFTGSPTHTSATVPNGGVAKVVANVADDSSYHWRARVADQTGRRGPWTSFGGNAETAADFVTFVPQIPNAPASLMQLRGSDQTPIPVGGANSTGSVVFRANVSDPDPGDQLRLEIEHRPIGTAFTNTFTAQSTPVSSGTTAEVTVSGLSDGVSYHWQARVVDQTARASTPWTAFGGNAESAADFVVAVPATQLVFTVQPTTTIAAASITPAIVVTALGADNNPALSFTDTIVLAIGTNPGVPAGTLSGVLRVKAVAGVATFPGLSINRSGTGYTLAATSTGVPGVTTISSSFNIQHGPPTQLAFTAQPTNENAGAPISPTVQVTARDAQGNTATAFTGSVTISIGNNPSGGTLSGTTTATATAGIASFSNLRIDKVGTGYTLTAAATDLSSATSSAFNITPAPASALVFTVQPSNASAGAAITPAVRVTARDNQGNVATGFTGNVTVALGTNPGGATLGGTPVVAAVAGVAIFSNLSVNLVGAGYTLTAASGSLIPDTSAAFEITSAAASRLVFTVQPTDVGAGATIAPSVEVSVRDGLGNLVPTFTGTVTVGFAANPGGGALSGTTSVSAVAGVATFGDLNINKSGVGYTLEASSAALSSDTSTAFAVSPAAPSKLVFAVQPSTGTAGANNPVTVAARDQFDNATPAYNGNVTLAIGNNPSGAPPGTITVAAVAGVATFNFAITRTGVGYTLTASGSGVSTATSNPFDILPGPGTQLAFTVQPVTTIAGLTMTPAVQVTARDQFGNTATGFSSNIAVAIGTNPGSGVLNGSTSVTPTLGVATFANLSINRTGTGYTLNASAGGLTGTTSAAFNITPNVATQLVFTVQPASEAAGSILTPAVVVTARDNQGNTATGYTGNITVAIGTNPGVPAGVLSGTLTQAAVAGIATFGNLSINRAGVGYTLTAAATNLTGATSNAFTISAANPTQLVFTVQPTNTVSGASITPAVQVTARDSLGNTATGFNGSITLAIANNPSGTGALSGTTTVAAGAGVANFPGLSINLVGTGYTLSASAGAAGNAQSSAFNITPAPAAQLVFTAQPTNDTAGKAMTPPVVVTARDAQGNTATGFTGNVTIAFGNNPGGQALNGTATVAAVAGVATFSNLRVMRTGNGYTFTASSGVLTQATSNAFNISPAPAVALFFSAQPSADTAGEAITPMVVVTARDSVGNTALSFTGQVTVAIGTNPGGGTLSGTTQVNAVAGVASFATISINRTGNGYTLTAAAAGLTGATSAAFNISPSTPTQLVITQQPTNTISGVAITPPVIVTARDVHGNTATQYTGSVTIAIGANPSAGILLPASTPTVNAVNGVATFTNVRIDKVGNGYTLTANADGLTGATTGAFNITPAGATQLAFTIQPQNTIAGAPIGPTVQVTALDANGNLAPTFTSNVTITLATNPVGALLNGTNTVAAVGGVATFTTLNIDTVANGYSFIAAAGGLAAATSDPFNITHAPASQLVFIAQPTTATAATTITPAVQVQARDQFGNTATGFTGSVTAAIGTNPGGGTLSGTTPVNAVNGVATFSTLSINRSGVGYTLTAGSGGLTGATSAAFNINPGVATQLAFTIQPTDEASAVAITPAIQVTARDAQGNTATSFTGAVTLAIGTNPSGGSLSGTTQVTAVAGVATFTSVSIDLVGNGYTLTAAAATVTGATSVGFNITSAPASLLVFTAQPTNEVAGVAISPAVVVTARDAQGNTATGFTGSVTIAIGANPGGGTLVNSTTTVAAVAGIATFNNLRINRTGNGYTLTATDGGGVTGATSAAFNVTPGPASALFFTTQPTNEVAGAAITPAVGVTARDSMGNTATSFTGAVTVAIGTNPGAGTLSGTQTVSAVAGVATFGGLSINRTGTGYTLTAADGTGVTGATSAAFNITHAAPSQLALIVQPTSAIAAAAITPAVQVQARDQFGNPATGFTGNVTVAIGANPGGGTLSGTLTVAAAAGVASFANLSINLVGNGYTLTAAATGLTGATSTTFNIVADGAAALFVTVQPTNTTAGRAITPPVQITARDPQGNTATGFTGTVTIAIANNPGGSTLTGTLTSVAVAGVATFNNLRLNRTGTGYTLTASSPGTTTATSSAFNITPAPAAALVFTVQPSTAVAGATITPAIQVTARDSVGNTATSFTGSVTMAIGTNPGGGTLSGASAVNAVAGVASFTNLSINLVGTGYTLVASDGTGVTSATSAAFNITPGPAATLTFTTQPSNEVAGVAISPAVQVTARDLQGNVATGFAGTVTIAIANNPGGSTLLGTLSAAAASGVATFNNLRLNRTGTGYTLTASATGPTSATSSAFNITPAPASVLVFTTQPTDEVAGIAINPAVVVTARDSVGNTATAFTGTVTMTIGTNPSGGSFRPGATTAVNAVAGIATFSNLRIDRTGTGYTLVASDGGGVSNGTSAAFNITPAPAVTLAFTTQPSAVTAGLAINPAVIVTARDSLANTATSFTGTVTLAIGTNPSGGAFRPGATTAIAAVAGVATFSNVRLDRTGTGYTLTAAATGLTGSTSAGFNVTPAPANVLVFTVQPSNETAGVAITPAIQVTARDSLANTATAFTGNVSLAINANPGSGTLTGGGPVAAVAGVATFAATSINRTGTGYTLNATAAGVTTGTSATFNIAAGPATQLAFTVAPSNTTAGATITPAVQVTARDAQGNTATSFVGNITVAIGTNAGTPAGTLSGTLTVAAAAGVSSFATLSINNAGNGYTLTAAAGGLTGATSAGFNVEAGLANQLFFTTQPATTTAGIAMAAVVVTARDNQGNVATGFTGNVTIAIGTNPGGTTIGGTPTVAAVAGIATFTNLRIPKTGTGYTLTASGGGAGAASSAAFNITPAPALRVVFTTQPVTTTAGVAVSPAVQVAAQDSLGNLVPTFAGNVSLLLSVNPGSSNLTGNTATASGGIATFNNLRLNRTGSGYVLLANAAGLISTESAAFNVVPAPASVLLFTGQPSSEIAGTVITPAVVVSARDSLDNAATGFNGNVTVAIGNNPGGSTLGGTATVAAVSGVATFSNLSLNRTGTGYTLTASAAGTNVPTSAAFNITPGTATQLAFTVQPTNTVSAIGITPSVQVTARDNQGNTATSFAGNITVAIGTNPSGGVLAGTATQAAASGVATFTGLSINLAGNGYTLNATASGLTGIASAAFNITAGPASVLVFTVQPTSATAGVAIAPAVQVTARDGQGNTATGFTSNVTLAIGTNPGAGTLGGSPTVAAVAGVATFNNVNINRTGNGYTLTAAAAGVTGATSATFNITPGVASVLVFTTQPANAVAATAISPAVVVTARDNQGNTATSFVGSVTIAIGTNPGGGTLSGTAAIAASAGVATFSTLSINLVGNGYTLGATAAGVTGATSTGFNITPGAPSVLAFTTQPSTETAGVAISPAVVVTARDNQGNTATSFVGNVTVAIGTNPGGGTLSGTTVVGATAGVATFSTLSINLVGNGYTLTAAAGGVSGAASTAFNITPAAASILVFTQQPSTTTAGGNITPTVQVTARDALGNVATGFAGNVTVAIGANPGGGTLGGTTTHAATAGLAAFPGLNINLAGVGYTLTAAATGLTGATSSAFNINPGAPTVLAFTVQPTSATAGVPIAPAVRVTARDNLGNTATSFTGSVSIAIGTNPGAGTLSGTTAIAAVAGVATFADLEINRTGNGYTLTATAAGLTGATSGTFNITPGAANVLVFTTQPVTTTAGAAIPALVVTARDDQGNTATGFAGNVTVAIGTNPSGGALGGTNVVAAVAGVATFPGLNINLAGNGYTLAATATGVTGVTSTSFNINPGTASVLVFTTQPSTETAGAAISPAVVVTARDNQGNTATSFTGTVTIAIGTNPSGGTLAGTAAIAATAGVATFANLSINLVGTGYTLNATAAGVTGATSAAFNITPGAASILVFTSQPTSATAGAAIAPAVVVTARDAQGNTATGFAGTVTVAIGTNPSGGILSGTAAIAATAGVASFSTLSINLVGAGYTLAATAAGVTGATSAAFSIVPGAASVLVFSTQPTSETAGVAISPAIVVTARDNQGNTATGFTGTVTVAIGTNPSGGTLAGTTAVAATAGVATFSTLSINLVGTGYTLTAAATGVTGATSTAFNITPGAATVLVFTVQPSSETAGAALTPAVVVTARDAQGNTATAFTGNVTVAIGTNPGGGTLAGTTALAATAGVATFANLSINLAGNGYTLTAAATGLTGATSAAFNITPGAASVLVFTTQPSAETAGVAISPAVVVTARDAQGNTATSFVGSVTVAIGTNPGGGTLAGTTAIAATAGIATFSNLSINIVGNGYTLTANAAGVTGATSAAFNITPGAASVLVFTQQPTSATAGVAITPSVVVTARDNQGNTATAFAGTVTIAIGSNPGGGTLSGTAALNAVAGVATFPGLSINRSGTGYTLTATDGGGVTGATSAAFNITPGAPTLLVFTQQPVSTTAGVAITPAVQVTARDNQGNTATSFTGTVTITIGTNPGGGTLAGTNATAAVAGVANFANLSINLAGIGYTLNAAATGLTGAGSTAFNITPGAAAALFFTTQPVTTTAGVGITPAVVVTARDNQGNTATGFAGLVTIAIGTNPGGGTLSGTPSVAATAGIASFPGLSINRAGTGYTLTATDGGGVTGATSAAFNITPGAASVLMFTQQPTNTTAGASITPTVQVTARDNQGNTATGFAGTVTVVIGTNPGTGTLSGTTAVAASGGIASFPGLSINAAGNGYTLNATATGPTGATSAAFNITPGAASVLVFTTQPTSTTAGAAITPALVVTARDNQGNTATSFTSVVTVAIGANPGAGTLAGTNAVAATAGIASFPGLSINAAANGYTLTAAATGVTGATSGAFNITPGAATLLVFTSQPTSETAGVVITPAVVVTARDAQGNTATAFTGNVTVAIGTNPGGGTLGGTAVVAATAGVATFSTLSVNLAGNGYTLTANAAGLTGATSAAFNITPGAASVLVFTTQPSSETAGVVITPAVVVTARDNQGNTATAFTGTVTVAIGTNPGGGTLAGTTAIAATAGVATFSGLSINLAGNGYTLTAAASGVTGATSAAFNITPGAASVLVFTTQPTSAVAGAAINPAVVVTARDNQGNTATSFAGTVTVAIGTNPSAGTLSGTAAIAATAGVASFPGLSINAAGNGYTLTAAAAGVTGATSAAFNIAPGAASILVFTSQPSSETAGVVITPAVVVTARDNQGNTATSFTGTVTVAIGTNPSGGALSGTAALAATAGVATFSGLSINLAGNGYTLTANAAGVTGATSAAFNITPGAASVLVFTQQPTTATAGVAISPTIVVTARDNQGNTATSFAGIVTVAIGTNPGAGTLSGTAAVAATAGVASFPGLSINRSGTGYTLTATDGGGVTGATSAAFNITPGAATLLVFTTQPVNTTAGAVITPAVVVTARDNQGNTATAFTGTVTVAIGTNPGSGTLSGTSALAAAAGVATFSGLNINAAGTGYTLTAAATGLTGATSSAFNITAGAATILVFTAQPTSATAGVAISPAVVVTARDAQGNTATGFAGSVTVAIGTNPAGGTLSGTTAIAATAGVATFSGLSINSAGNGYTLTAAATGVTGATSTAFNITAGAATLLAFTTQPSSDVAGVAITPAIVVTARDNQGNTATTFTGTVTVAIGANPGAGTLSGTAALNAVAGVATFPGLSINRSGVGYTLTAAATGLTGATSAAFDITPGTASVLVFTQQPTNATAGVAITPAVQVTARDNQGNTATAFTGTVTVAIGTNPSGGTLSGTAAVAATAGVASFPGLSINAAGNGYTLNATATGPTGATSTAFNIAPGTASVLVFTTHPVSTTAGAAITPAVVVTARDNQGNTATAFTGTVTVAIGTNPSAGTLSGTAAVAAAAGVASFPGLSINAAGNGYTLTATATGPGGATSAAFNITPGVASVLVFSTQPTTATAGVAFAPTVVVTARDNQGNTATAFTGTVTLAIGTNPSAGTLAGTAAVAATAGVASFPGISINAAGNGYTLTAGATGPTGATSATFNIVPGAASVLVFTTQPASQTAGVAITPAIVVTARDNQGNTATAFTGTVTVAIGTNPGAGTLSGTNAIAATAGVATFAGLSINRSGTGYTLTASATGPTSGTSAAFNITPGTASVLVFTTQPVNTTAGAAITPAVVITARDNQGNTATAFTGTVTVAIGTNPAAGTLSGTNAVAATAGVAAFPGLSINAAGNGYTLAATATGPAGATSAAFNIVPGAASVLVFTTQPGSQTAGVAITPAIVVTARDNQGNTATAFTGTVTVAIGTNPSAGTLSGASALAATAGVATFANLSINAAGNGYTLTAGATGVTGATSAAFNITAGAANQLVFTTQPTSQTAGVVISPPVVVTARDNLGNTVTTFTGTVNVAIGTNPSSGTLSGTTAIAATAGVATFSTLSINAAGNNYTLTATATGLTGATSSAFNITAGAAAVLVFTVQPTTSGAGQNITPPIQVTARDNQGNTATSFTGNVTLAIGTNPGGGVLSGTATQAANNGIAAFNGMSINAAGTGYTLTASATGLSTGTSATFNITPGAASILVFTQQPTTATAGVAITPTIVVTARDNLGNTATGFNGTVTVAIGTNPGAGTLSGTAAVSAVAGIASFPGLSINRSGNGYTLTATDGGGVTGATSAAFNITPGAANVLVFTTQPVTTTAGAAITPAVVVTARDNQGNTATAFTGIVTVAIGTNPSAGTLSGTNAVAAVAGVASFPGLNINAAGNGYTLAATATGPTGATSSAFNITPGAASILVFTTQPTAAIAGAAITPSVVVTARDDQGNTATSFTGNVTVAIGTNPSSGVLSGTPTQAAVAGVASFLGLSINAAGNGYTLTAAAGGVTGATSTAFNIAAGGATTLVFTAQPTTSTAGVAISPAVVVTARDNLGNTATTFTGTVNIAIGTNAGGGTLSGTAAIAATAGVATFSTLSINLVGTGYTFTAASTGLTGATSAAFNITPGPASVLVFTGQPTTATAGVAITPAIVVTARDNQGNTATSFTGTVTAVIGTNPGAGTLSGTLNVSAVAGIASFTTLSINRSGTGYTLTAAATGLTGATSGAFNINAAAVNAAQSTVAAVPGVIPASSGGATSTVTVTARDQFGNPVSGATVVIASNGTDNFITQPVGTTSAAGVATGTFASSRAETKTISATANGVPITQSSAVFVQPTTPSATLSTVAATSPITASGGTSQSTITVTVRDQFSNLISSANVTWAATGTGNTVTNASGTTTAGVFNLGRLSSTVAESKTVSAIVNPGASQVVITGTATVVVNPSAISAATSTVAAGTASITACASSCVAGSTASTITVTARDAFGNIVPNVAVVVAATGSGNGFNPGASGNANGSGVFTTAFNSIIAEAKTISATAAGVGITETANVTVTPAAAAELVFAIQPAGGTVVSPITPAMVVAIRDAFGNTVTGFAGTVTMTIENDASGGTAVLSGTNPATVVNGTATFSDLQINQVGDGYTLRATAGSLSAISAPFNVGLVL